MKLDINKIKKRLLIKYPLFGSIIANLNYIENKEIPTAGTDGNTMYYNPEFLGSLSENQQTFIFAHEVCHIALDHLIRSEGKNKKIWNMATDAVINAYLVEDGLEMVDGGIDIPEAINYSAEEMYYKLLEEQKQELQNEQQEKQNENDSDEKEKDSNNVGHDSHDMWDKAIEDRKKEQNEEETKETDNKKDNNRIDDKDIFKQNQIERKKQLDELRKELSKESIGHGDMTNSIQRQVGSIGYAKPLIDWRKALREAVKYDVDWSYQNATIEDGIVTPHLEEQPKPETEIILDTSGSVSEILLKNFLRECKNILTTSKVKVGCFDTKFYGFKDIRSVNDIDKMEFEGGGGTNFDVAVEAFTKRVENKIIFTDGGAPMPRKELEAIWVVFGNNTINPKGGKVIQIDRKQLKSLYNFEKEERDEER